MDPASTRCGQPGPGDALARPLLLLSAVAATRGGSGWWPARAGAAAPPAHARQGAGPPWTCSRRRLVVQPTVSWSRTSTRASACRSDGGVGCWMSTWRSWRVAWGPSPVVRRRPLPLPQTCTASRSPPAGGTAAVFGRSTLPRPAAERLVRYGRGVNRWAGPPPPTVAAGAAPGHGRARNGELELVGGVRVAWFPRQPLPRELAAALATIPEQRPRASPRSRQAVAVHRRSDAVGRSAPRSAPRRPLSSSVPHTTGAGTLHRVARARRAGHDGRMGRDMGIPDSLADSHAKSPATWPSVDRGATEVGGGPVGSWALRARRATDVWSRRTSPSRSARRRCYAVPSSSRSKRRPRASRRRCARGTVRVPVRLLRHDPETERCVLERFDADRTLAASRTTWPRSGYSASSSPG